MKILIENFRLIRRSEPIGIKFIAELRRGFYTVPRIELNFAQLDF